MAKIPSECTEQPKFRRLYDVITTQSNVCGFNHHILQYLSVLWHKTIGICVSMLLVAVTLPTSDFALQMLSSQCAWVMTALLLTFRSSSKRNSNNRSFCIFPCVYIKSTQ